MTEPDETAPAHADPVEPQAAEGQGPTTYEIIPSFTPVPREMNRHDGWTADTQRRFVEALAETGSVTAAARTVHRATRGAYELRRHPEAAEFRRAWDAALDIAVRQIEDGAMDRAINGVQIPIHSGNKIVGYRTQHNERLTTFFLQHRAPERFGGMRRSQGARGDNAIDKMELNRLRKQWREEWDREQGCARIADSLAARASIMAKLEKMRDEVIAESRRASPKVVALLDAYEAARDEEARNGPPEPLPLLPGITWPLLRAGETPDESDEAEWEDLIEPDKRAIEPAPPPAHPSEDLAAPPAERVIELNGPGWQSFDPRRNDGRATEWSGR